jgi:outer membrane receptor protein involved in Fe transport
VTDPTPPCGTRSARQPGYTNTSLNLTYTSADGSWDFGVYARNLENSTVLTDAEVFGAGGTNAYYYGYAPPRTYGFKLAKHF